jgi:hypothetical protein
MFMFSVVFQTVIMQDLRFCVNIVHQKYVRNIVGNVLMHQHSLQ